MNNSNNSETVIDSLKWRYAVKKFDSSKKIDDVIVKTLLEAVQLTPTSMGLQPFKILLVKSEEAKLKLLDAVYNKLQVNSCSHILVFCRRNDVNENYIEDYMRFLAEERGEAKDTYKGFEKVAKQFVSDMSNTELKIWTDKQIYIALGVLLTACAELKIDSCPMEGFKPKVLDEVFNLQSSGVSSVVICPIGIRDKDDDFSRVKKVRLSLDDMVLDTV